MNNKDLFNAINDIDEKFITDAGKYLKNDFGGFRNDEPIEVRPAERTFSPMRWIASIAAALVLFAGIAVAMKAGIITINLQPLRAQTNNNNNSTSHVSGENNGAYASQDSTPAQSGASINASAENDQWKAKPSSSKELPFSLYGPDLKQIKYGEITGVNDNMNISELDESDLSNVTSITCDGFAYINEPRGANYNSIEIPGMFTDDVHFADNGNFRRIYEGEKFGALTVKYASSSFEINPKVMWGFGTEENYTVTTPTLRDNIVSFDGTIDVEGFLIKDENSDYHFIMCQGETQIPAMNFANSLKENGSYTTQMVYENINGYKYMGELPAMDVTVDESWNVEAYYPYRDWQRVMARLTDISVDFFKLYDRGNYSYVLKANVVSVVPCDWYDVPSTPTSMNEKTYDIIDKAQTIADLDVLFEEENILSSSLGYFRVYYLENGTDKVELFKYDQPLKPGMMIYLYDKSGKVILTHIYRKDMTQ